MKLGGAYLLLARFQGDSRERRKERLRDNFHRLGSGGRLSEPLFSPFLYIIVPWSAGDKLKTK